ncbi:Integral membrane protein TerC [Denitrovibrio acetiphilus DSM 12809]|uniref:Integral membrane protein TerC n=1 Tax=Denitrovibrio acetiphilus (strain DSM 12809 / NBRC 114555 / N2460) TaxID=522772 RepID=D4H2C5_DENA2|nr:TerC family protein [Denitrovibrio acetiphilus]ADD68916.1 Integral membrane protein TerC [Denitrovibrio acetiphilus DSM 12809]
MEFIFSFEVIVALLTLTVLEIVLGIDNIIFISILTGRLEESEQDKARIIGLALAMLMRIGLVFMIFVIVGMTKPLFEVRGFAVSLRDLILFCGGLFLLAKSTTEIHHAVEVAEDKLAGKKKITSFSKVIVQIVLVDMVFSIDSVITAVGMVSHVWIMVVAIVISVGVMMAASGAISDFIGKHPTLKVLALSFLILIGMSLIGESLHFHIPKGYLYFAMAFSSCVEILNIKMRSNTSKPAV